MDFRWRRGSIHVPINIHVRARRMIGAQAEVHERQLSGSIDKPREAAAASAVEAKFIVCSHARRCTQYAPETLLLFSWFDELAAAALFPTFQKCIFVLPPPLERLTNYCF